ncbi:VWA domain-containing protein [Gracilibacillus caseinilyticus]|uniref:VWA domain-containing protein n=1 Tax=Gracilibacillus caseinilyticus TaxID=2932256 RepID=A0ABY4EZN3_9BACI|nr:VWA domain-containing protein [Gracilibacillus caseinilyticus]UOQ49729.1 VWA domain-containing protein [Gracilibacillus caseinilyticus]
MGRRQYTWRCIALFGWILFLLLLLAACSGETKEEESLEAGKVITPSEEEEPPEEQPEPTDEKEESVSETNYSEEFDTDPLPTTVEELAALEKGKYARKIFNNKDGAEREGSELLDHLGEDMPEISNNPSEAELDYFFRETLKLVQDDYSGEEEILKALKFQLLGSPEVEDPRYQFKEHLNIAVLLDASGSMAQEINGKTKMEAAKETITAFLEELPEETNVALRVYGQEGTSADSDKELSCSSSEIIYGYSPYEEATFSEALNSVQPAGWTPNGLALSKAQEDLAEFKGEENTNIVYLVSDGIETCDTKPVEVAKQFYDSNIQPIINVIGFDVDSEGQNHLKEIANAAEGLYQTVQDEDELANELNKINEMAEAWNEWKEKGEQAFDLKETQNSIDIFVYTTQNLAKLSEEKESVEYILEALLATDKVSDDIFYQLKEINSNYHTEMRTLVEQQKDRLEEWNENSYKEALQMLEDKYQENKE